MAERKQIQNFLYKFESKKYKTNSESQKYCS